MYEYTQILLGSFDSRGRYGVPSVKRLSEFLKTCRKQLKDESSLFWVSLQSNALADLSSVGNEFARALIEMKEELKTNGWILPALQANMRNQVNIANVQVEKDVRKGSSVRH